MIITKGLGSLLITRGFGLFAILRRVITFALSKSKIIREIELDSNVR